MRSPDLSAIPTERQDLVSSSRRKPGSIPALAHLAASARTAWIPAFAGTTTKWVWTTLGMTMRGMSVFRTPAYRPAPFTTTALALALFLLTSAPASAQTPTYGLGRTPTAAEVRAWDIMISPTGAELPPGSGTARQGAPIYEQKCAHCHGVRGVDGDAPRLVKPERTVTDPWQYGRILPIRSPYATLVWDFINRGMPLEEQGTLTADEVYALTALMLYWNGLVGENEVMNAQSLPAVKMPMADNWARVPDWAPGQPRYPGYPY